MLMLAKKSGTTIMAFESYKSAHQFITLLEDIQVMRGRFRHSRDYWAFTVFSPEQVEQLNVTLAKCYNRETMRNAMEQKVSMLDVCEGNPDASRQYLLDGSFNLESLREDWCKDYCECHGLVLSEGGE